MADFPQRKSPRTGSARGGKETYGLEYRDKKSCLVIEDPFKLIPILGEFRLFRKQNHELQAGFRA